MKGAGEPKGSRSTASKCLWWRRTLALDERISHPSRPFSLAFSLMRATALGLTSFKATEDTPASFATLKPRAPLAARASR